eukprot:CAMPEP_0179894838 /NCGR_PEP_ID=MMETSP0982-20121206/35499_1 /TAXON_ID=483367 /ORGANISM="non described non described, Strain CCMP 2436" /LENGTH=180 /DNA_ID=CAMNT_0021791455 /DNA_START=211 /DNA_END=753 /DNA_ORIENTATION=+
MREVSSAGRRRARRKLPDKLEESCWTGLAGTEGSAAHVVTCCSKPAAGAPAQSSSSRSPSWKFSARLGHTHFRPEHACFFTPFPPNLGLSLQLTQAPQSGRKQLKHVPHRDERILLLSRSSSSSASGRLAGARFSGARALPLLSTKSAEAAALPVGESGPSKLNPSGSRAPPGRKPLAGR